MRDWVSNCKFRFQGKMSEYLNCFKRVSNDDLKYIHISIDMYFNISIYMYIYLWFHESYNGLGLFGIDCHFFSLTSEFLGVSEDRICGPINT